MGTELNIKCFDCGYTKNIILGIGMRYGDVLSLDPSNTLLPTLFRSKKMIEEIKFLVNHKHATYDSSNFNSYGHELFRCNKCHEFYGRFHLELTHDDGTYKTEYNCPKCKVKLERLYSDKKLELFEEQKLDIEKYPCPKCGKYNLVNFNGLVMWD